MIPQQNASSEVCAAVTDVIEDNEYWSRKLVILSRSRQINRLWLEKLLVLIDGVQLYALLWQLSQPWLWSARWLAMTRWTNAFNLDFYSFLALGVATGSTEQSISSWGEMSRYWLYAFAWGLVPWAGVVVLQMAKITWTKQGRSDFILLSVKWENVLLQVLQFLYVPVGLAVLRLVKCNANGNVSAESMVLPCGSVEHVAVVLAATCVLGGGFLVGLPLILRRRIQDAIVYSNVKKHERFLIEKELEYILGTSNSYLELYMPLFASFRRHAIYMPVQMCMLKLVLLLTLSTLRSSPSSTNKGAKELIFSLALVSMAVYKTKAFPYRCVSTSYFAVLVDWMLVANGVFVLLCANGVRSALTVPTSVTSSLTFLNASFLIIIGFKELRDIVQLYMHPQSAKIKRQCWPTNDGMEEIVTFGPKVEFWVKVIHNAQKTVLKSLLVIPSMRSYQDLKSALDEVELCYKEAAVSDHLLTSQLYEVFLNVYELYVEAVASNPFYQIGYPAKDLANLAGVFERRHDRQLLLSSRTRRILNKVHIARSWLRRTEPHAVVNNWERTTVDIEEFLDAERDCYLTTSVASATN